MNKIIFIIFCIFSICVPGFSQELKTQPVSAKTVEAIKQNLPDWTISQNPKLYAPGMTIEPTFEFKLQDKAGRKVSIRFRLVDDEQVKESYFDHYFTRPIMPSDSSRIEGFVDKGFMVGTGNRVDGLFSKANLMVEIDLSFPIKAGRNITPYYYFPAPKEEKDRILKIIEVLAKSIESAATIRYCQNTFFKYPSIPGESLEENLLSASAVGNVAELTDILRRNADLNYRLTKNTDFASTSNGAGNTALHFAAQQGCVETVKALVSAKADLNSINKRGETPLMLAAYHSNLEAAHFLISANANVQTESFGRNAAFFAINATQNINASYRSDIRKQKTPQITPYVSSVREILKELSAKGLDLKKKDSFNGNTLLNELLSNSGGDFAFEISRLLLESGVDPNEANNSGDTPLLQIANRLGTDSVRTMQLLISQGADATKNNKNDETALGILLKKQVEYKNDKNYSKVINEAIELLTQR